MTIYQLKSIIQKVDDFTIAINHCEFKEGVIYAVTGPNGSGKTTLLDALGLISRPNSGTLTFSGSIVEYDNQGLLLAARRNIGHLMQNPYLFNMSVLKNISYGLELRNTPRPSANERAEKVMEQLSLSHLAKRNTHSLSKGESQRVAIARTIAVDTPVYLLDEPFANVDKASTGIIEDIITSLKKEKNATVIFSTHSTSQAERIADESIELDCGKII